MPTEILHGGERSRGEYLKAWVRRTDLGLICRALLWNLCITGHKLDEVPSLEERRWILAWVEQGR
jgi:hypothetical protein